MIKEFRNTALGICVLALAACATTPAPTEEIIIASGKIGPNTVHCVAGDTLPHVELPRGGIQRAETLGRCSHLIAAGVLRP